MKVFVAILLLIVAVSAQQPPAPAVNMTGRIGAQGNFPLLNGGTIIMPADADYTLANPDFRASVLRIESSVPLSQTRNIIHNLPANPAQRFGFEFTVQNATSGEHDIVFKGSTGAGVTIPNGKTIVVMFDGTNYVSVGAPSGPVIEGGEGGTHDVREYGVKADGLVVGCNVQASTTIYCFDYPYAKPPVIVKFTQADVGKLIIIYGKGPHSGRVIGTISVVSGGTGGKDGWQPIFWDDPGDGCNTKETMPYAYVMVTNGHPTGNIWIPIFQGRGCTRPPTRGTVGTVTGEVTFTGGQMNTGDWPTKITAVHNENLIEVAELPPGGTAEPPFGTTVVYGTDDHDAWERACNARSVQTIRFSGISLIGKGINCGDARFYLQGDGWGHLTDNPDGSQLIYAGKGRSDTPVGRDHILQIHGGYGTRIERMSFKGNTMAQPIAVLQSLGRSRCTVPGQLHCTENLPPDWTEMGGKGIQQMTIFDQVSFGFFFGDDPTTFNHNSYQLQSCVYADGVMVGNVDFTTVRNSYCHGAVVGFDANNGMATNWKFEKLQAAFDDIGTAVFGRQIYEDYYTEFNRLDISMGSPTNAGGVGKEARFILHGGESSTKSFEYSQFQNAGDVLLEAENQGLPTVDRDGNWLTENNPVINPWGTWVDLTKLRAGRFEYHGVPYHQGKIKIVNLCPSNFQLDVTLIGPSLKQVDWSGSELSLTCTGLPAGWFHIRTKGIGRYGGSTIMLDEQFPSTQVPQSQLRNDNFFQNTTGSIKVRSPFPPGRSDVPNQVQYFNVFAGGATGSTAYRYQITCTDGQGLETDAYAAQTVADGTATLSDTNYNGINFPRRNGCVDFNLYGDEGSGDIGFLHTVNQWDFEEWTFKGYRQTGLRDTGIWTKTSRKPPAVSHSGSVDAERFTIGGQLLASAHLADFSATPPFEGQVPVFDSTIGKYVPGNVGGAGGPGVTEEVGFHDVGSHDTSVGPNVITFVGFTAPSAGLRLIDCKINVVSNPAGKAYCALYQGNGAGSSPGTLLCNDTTGTALTHTGWNVITSTVKPSCPTLVSGSKYFIAIALDAPVTISFLGGGANSGQPYEGMSYYFLYYGPLLCCEFPANAAGASSNTNIYSMSAEVSSGSGGGSTGGSFTAGGDLSGSASHQQVIGIHGHAVPNVSSEGFLHWTGSEFAWGTPPGGGGGTANVWSITQSMPMATIIGATVFTQTMVTPATDSTYYLTWQIQQVDTGQGGTCNVGALGVALGFTESISNAPITAYISGRAFNAPGGTNSFSAGTTIDATNYFVGFPFEFTAKQGVPVTFTLTQTTASNCTNGQNFVLRAHLKAW